MEASRHSLKMVFRELQVQLNVFLNFYGEKLFL